MSSESDKKTVIIGFSLRVLIVIVAFDILEVNSFADRILLKTIKLKCLLWCGTIGLDSYKKKKNEHRITEKKMHKKIGRREPSSLREVQYKEYFLTISEEANPKLASIFISRLQNCEGNHSIFITHSVGLCCDNPNKCKI